MILKVKCPDCHRDYEVEEDIKLIICKCGACAFDREEYDEIHKQRTK